jgi:hypothetical protein
MNPDEWLAREREEYDPDPHEGQVQCHSCQEWWDEDSDGCPYASDWCVDNENAYCTECRQEMNE